MQTSDKKLEGKKIALTLVNKLNSLSKISPPPPLEPGPPILETSTLVEAIQALADNHVDLMPLVEVIKATQTERLDITPIVKAINNMELNFDIDLSAITTQLKTVAERPAVNTKPIVDKLGALVEAMNKNTSVLSKLVDAAKATKIVQYDNIGRITEIKLK